MARQSRWWRPRDLFPRTIAALIQTRRAPHHARLRVKAFFESPSLWTTSVLAGMLAIVLTLLLFVVGPPPDVALEPAAELDSPAREPRPAPWMTLTVQHGAFPAWWDQREQLFVQSRPVPASVPFQFAVADAGWTPTAFPAMESTAETVPVAGRLVLPTADDPPFVDSSDLPPDSPLITPNLQLGVTIEKVRRSEGGQLQEYALIVRNESSAAIERVVVREFVPDVNQLVAVEPRPFISRDGELLWQIGTMGPGEELQFNVSCLSSGEDSFETQSVADMQSRIGVVTRVSGPVTPESFGENPEPAVAESEMSLPEPVLPAGLAGDPAPLEPAESVLPASVEEAPEPLDDPARDVFPFAVGDPEPVLPAVEPPPAVVLPAAPELALPAGWPPLDREAPAEPRPRPLSESAPLQALLRINSTSPEVVARGDVVTTIYEVTNDGTAAAENLTLTVHLTGELLHRHGANVKHTIDRLEPGETRQARLLTRAREYGTATLDAALTHDGKNADAELSYIRVTPTDQDAPAADETLR